ncbi:hypothetical protein COO60DRAFT_1501473 [Scenedesmus sp. NREL 46B-D3]|nr:hypothetical protein COO60DRAFT_1501473 [Scenedesmus sp. NREL 46B-D3]
MSQNCLKASYPSTGSLTCPMLLLSLLLGFTWLVKLPCLSPPLLLLLLLLPFSSSQVFARRVKRCSRESSWRGFQAHAGGSAAADSAALMDGSGAQGGAPSDGCMVTRDPALSCCSCCNQCCCRSWGSSCCFSCTQPMPVFRQRSGSREGTKSGSPRQLTVPAVTSSRKSATFSPGGQSKFSRRM